MKYIQLNNPGLAKMNHQKFLFLFFAILFLLLMSCGTPNNSGEKSHHNTKEIDPFQSFIEDCPYDKQLQTELENGVLSISEMYSNYLQKWTDEMTFTIENAKSLFQNAEEYAEWMKKKEAWLNTTLQSLNIESDQFLAELQRGELLLSTANLIRQNALDTKYFCYLLEVENGEINQFASLKWKESK